MSTPELSIFVENKLKGATSETWTTANAAAQMLSIYAEVF